MEIMQYFKVVIIIMLFYGFGITVLTHSLPDDMLKYTDYFDNVAGADDIGATGESIQQSLEKQTNIPVVDMGALVFYSGNFLLDMLINFATAIPQMIGLLLTGMEQLIGYDAVISNDIQIFATTSMGVIYIISLIQLVAGIRSGRAIT